MRVFMRDRLQSFMKAHTDDWLGRYFNLVRVARHSRAMRVRARLWFGMTPVHSLF
jgi:hypothetical protein